MPRREDPPVSRARLLQPAAWLLVAACGSAGAGAPAAPAESVRPAESAAPAAGPPPAPAYGNSIKWKTASELDNFGYDVYRGESPEGPFERINPRVIEGAGTTDEPTAYEYVDRGVDPRKTYYYYVESISMDGVRKRFTPIGTAEPKILAVEEPAGDLPGSGAPDRPGPGPG